MKVRDIPPLKPVSTTGKKEGIILSGNKGQSFVEILKDSIKEVDDLQKEADKAIIELAAGKTKNIHETMIAIEKADISFRLMMQVRNKIIEAYQEIMRMAV